MTLSPMTNVLIRDRKGRNTEDRREGQVKTKMSIRQPQTKELLEPPELEEATRDFLLELLGGQWSC